MKRFIYKRFIIRFFSSLTLCTGLFICIATSKAQHIDSLLTELPKQKEDTNKVILLDQIIEGYFDDPLKQPPFLEAMLSLSKKLNYSWGESRAYRNYALYMSFTNRLDEEFGYLHKADSMYEKYNDTFGQACLKNIMGKYYTSIGKFEEALQSYQASLSYFEQENSTGALRNQGVNLGDMAILFQEMKRYKEAEYYYLRSLDIDQKTGDGPGMAATLNNLGTMLLEQEQFDKALVYLKKCLELEQNMGEKKELYVLTKCKANIGFIYVEKQRYTESLEMLRECYANFGKMGDTLAMGTMQVYQAYAYRKQGMPDKSLEQLDAGIRLITPFQPENDELSDFYSEYYEAYKAMGKYKEALESYEKYVEYNKGIFSTETANKISELKEKYETEKKEQENLTLKANNELKDLRLDQQEYFIYGMSGIVLLIILLSILIFRNNKISAEQKTTRLEQKLLRGQMNPHFIFNALIAIQSFIYKNEPKEAGKFLSSFARLMRAILENSREEYITLAKEIKWLEDYIQLQQLRFNSTFNYIISVENSIDKEDVLIPPMLFQPFVENALEHGLNQLEKEGKLMIQFSILDGYLIVDIKDNGPGFSETETFKKGSEHVSLATTITRDRLKLLNRRKNKKISFTISSPIQQDTTISFNIPLKTNI